MATNDITIYQGNDMTLRTTAVDVDGAAYDLAGAVLHFQVKKYESDAIALISKSSAVATEILIIVPATNGIFETYLLPADTVNLEGDYVYDITMVVGGKTYTLEKSEFAVRVPVR